MTPHTPRLLAPLALCLALASGCSTYNRAYDYGSRPVTAPVGGAARVDATVVGVREGGPGSSAAVDLRLRIERTGATPVALVGEGLRLRLGSGEVIDATDVRPLGPAVPAAGGATSFTASFRLPGRNPAKSDLSSLGLVVALDVGGRRELATLGFERGELSVLWIDPWGWPGPDASGQPTGWRQ